MKFLSPRRPGTNEILASELAAAIPSLVSTPVWEIRGCLTMLPDSAATTIIGAARHAMRAAIFCLPGSICSSFIGGSAVNSVARRHTPGRPKSPLVA